MKSQLITARDGWGAKFPDFLAFYRNSKLLIGVEWLVEDAPVVGTRVNHGRWIADCPFCTGSEMVWFEELSLFFCFSCRNKAVGGHLLKVAIPKDYKKIEGILMIRHPVNRNWQGETLSALKAENTKMGVV